MSSSIGRYFHPDEISSSDSDDSRPPAKRIRVTQQMSTEATYEPRAVWQRPLEQCKYKLGCKHCPWAGQGFNIWLDNEGQLMLFCRRCGMQTTWSRAAAHCELYGSVDQLSQASYQQVTPYLYQRPDLLQSALRWGSAPRHGGSNQRYGRISSRSGRGQVIDVQDQQSSAMSSAGDRCPLFFSTRAAFDDPIFIASMTAFGECVYCRHRHCFHARAFAARFGPPTSSLQSTPSQQSNT